MPLEATPKRRHAVVIGGGIAGLLAARVLADRFGQVTLIERDPTTSATPRRGAPQGAHVHALLKAGELVLERLFPGLTRELEARGSTRVRFARDIHWFHHDTWASEGPADLTIQTQTRPLLEDAIRVRLAREGGVKLLAAAVRGLAFDADRSRVVGVEVLADPRHPEILAADVVVDASGRGSRLPEWLAAAGYERPGEEGVQMDLTYASRL